MPTFFTTEDTRKMMCVVHAITRSECCFATAEDEKHVYIDRRLTAINNLNIGDTVEAIVVPNFLRENQQTSAAYRAIAVTVKTRLHEVLAPKAAEDTQKVEEALPEPAPELSEENLCLRIRLLLEKSSSPMTSAQIGEQLDVNLAGTGALTNMVANGRLAVAKVYASGTQTRSSLNVYSDSVNKIIKVLTR